MNRGHRLRCPAEVLGHDALASNEYFSIRRNPYLLAFNNLSNGAPPGLEGMVRRHNGTRFREPIALYHDETEAPPEFFLIRRESRAADDQGPKLQPEEGVNLPVSPPANEGPRHSRHLASILGKLEPAFEVVPETRE